MHPNPTFRTAPRDQNLAFAAERGFGTLTINGPAGPLAAHVPFDMGAGGDVLDLHLVRSNPIAQALRDGSLPALMAVNGADGYISPDWYGLPDQVPTWNYVAVHLRGQLELLPQTGLRDHLDRLSVRFEQRLAPKTVWTTAKMPEELVERLMRMIVPARLAIEDVQGTWKLGQNKPAVARQVAASQMAVGAIGQDIAFLAALMQQYDQP